MAADPIIYCLENVTDYDQFERLCHDVMAAEGYSAIEPLGGMKDKGRDAIHVDRHDPSDVTIFAYSVREDWRAKLDEDCAKIQNHGHSCQRLAFLCTASFTATERDNAIANVRDTFRWELNLYGLERLRVLLATVHRQVIANHPQIFCPPFFPQAGGLTVVNSPDYLLIDYADLDEALATWLARRLTLEGYQVWCRSIAPVGGSSLNHIIETLVKNRAFRLVSILSPPSIADPDLSARRTLATAIRPDLLLPIVASPVEPSKLDAKTRALESIPFNSNWTTGLARLLDVLTAAQCPRAPGGATIALRSYMPSDVLLPEQERLISNRFRVLGVPEALQRFTSAAPLAGDAFIPASLQWAFRRVDPCRFIAFHPPPEPLRQQLDIRPSGGVAWRHFTEIEAIAIRNLVPELIRKSLQVTCRTRGLQYCNHRRCLYFPHGLLSAERLYFTKPDGSRSFVGVAGQRTYWHPGASVPYKYQLVPVFSVTRLPQQSFAVVTRIRVRLTDEHDACLRSRTALSRRKHLCKGWWNDDWLNRILAVMQFLAGGDTITIGESPNEVITITVTPDQWTVPVRINEAALEDAAETHEEAISYGAHDDEPDDE